jgi:cytochrome bd-type quinol oxidase subunit 2
MPPVDQPQRPNVVQPPPVHTAVRLMWVGAAINVVGIIVGLITMGSKSQIREQIATSGQQVNQAVVNAAYATTIVSLIVGGVIGALLWLWMAWKNGQGRRWARILATVFAAINLVSTIYSVIVGSSATVSMGNGTVASMIVGVVGLIVGIVVVVLLWLKPSSEFFNAHRRPVA